MQLLLCALLLLKNVNVVDIDSGAIVAGRSVVVSEGYIKEIGAQETVRAPAGARVIDGSGRYLMPALWDMHTHPMEPEALSMLVANGVGGTRIMWGLPRHLEWRARVELGELLGPRLLIAGPIIEGVPPAQAAGVVDTEGRRLVKTFAEGVAEVRRQKTAGFDYIKVYNNIPLDAYNGLVRRSGSAAHAGRRTRAVRSRNPGRPGGPSEVHRASARLHRKARARGRADPARHRNAVANARMGIRGSIANSCSWCARRGTPARGNARRSARASTPRRAAQSNATSQRLKPSISTRRRARLSATADA